MNDLIKLQKSASNKTLLYIDGDKALQKNYSLYFSRSFKGFYQAFDGEEGLNQFKKYSPDVVILNLELEKLDAIELISEIKDINEHVILISLSEDCEDYTLLQTLDMGLDKMLLKPASFAKIANLLVALLPAPLKPQLKTPKKPKVSEQPKVEKKKEEPKKTVKKPESKVVKKQIKSKNDSKLKEQNPVKVTEPKVTKPIVKTDLEVCWEFIKNLADKQTLVEFINSYKGVMVLHDGTISHLKEKRFFIQVNIAQILAAKTENQMLIKTHDNKYIHAELESIDLKTTTIELKNPRILVYKHRDKEFARILADNSFKAGIYYKKKHIDFDVSYISFRSAVLVTKNMDIEIKPNTVIDITLGFNISGPNAMIKDKKFTKVFAKCEVIRVDEKSKQRDIIVLLQVSKAGERTLKKYLLERESEIIYEFKSRVRR